MAVLNENIYEFDDMEKKKIKKYSLKDYLKRIILIIDEKLFERTYREEYEKANKEIAMLQSRVILLQRNLKHVYREKKNIEKRLSKYE